MYDYFELLIPLAGIAIGPLIVWVIFSYTHKNHLEVQKTIRAMIENGQAVPPDVMTNLSETRKPSPEERREKDLRWGIIFIALGIACVLFGFFAEVLGEHGDWSDFWKNSAISTVFFLIGLARLFLWQFSNYETGSTKH